MKESNLKMQRDRITDMLGKIGQPSFGGEIGDISQAFLNALSTGQGAAGYQNAFQGLQQQRQAGQEKELQKQMSIYDIMQQEAAQGNQDVMAVDQAIKNVAGSNLQAYEKIANAVHEFPEEVGATNANLIVAKIANQLGVKAPLTKEEIDLKKLGLDERKTNAEIAKINTDISKSKLDMMRAMAQQQSGQPIDPALARSIDKDVIIKTRDAGNTASTSLRLLDQLEEALKNQKTGKLQAGTAKMLQYVPGASDSKTVTNFQVAEAISNKLALEATALLKGASSDKDVALSLTTKPSFADSPEAIKKKIKNQRIGYKIIEDIPKFTMGWRQKYGNTLNTDEEGKSYDQALVEWQGKKFKELGGKSFSEGQEKVANYKNKYGLD